MTRGFYAWGARFGIAAASVFLASAGQAADPDVGALARQLSAAPAPAPCPNKLPDGSCPDQVDTRQLVMPGKLGRSSAPASIRSRPVRQDISMTFDKGSARLTPHAREILDRLAVALKGVSYRPFTIEGHTDKSGTREMNMQLSQARAQAVVSYLASKGVDPSRMKAIGYGYDRPLPGVSADQPENRRVEASAL